MDALPIVLNPALLPYIGAALAEQPEPELGSTGNPVKTLGIEGTREYIASLDCENGAMPEYKHESTAEIGPSGKKFDKYIMRCEANSVQIFAIYLDANHAETTTRPVKGFTSWL